jgi:hypothetical protein
MPVPLPVTIAVLSENWADMVVTPNFKCPHRGISQRVTKSAKANMRRSRWSLLP